MNQISTELKQEILRRLLPPNNESVSKLSRESGISETTLYKWKKSFRHKGQPQPYEEHPAGQWSAHDKFAIVVETAALSEIELSEYCRAKRLYVEQVTAWREACMQANDGVTGQASKLHKDLRQKEQEIKALSRELQRKEAALAETAALLVLRKKAQAIWGDPEDE